MLDKANIVNVIEHTNLHPAATRDDISRLCRQALRYDFASVCVNPCYVEQSYEILKGTRVAVCTVIGFPLGTHATEVKVVEAKKAIQDGASELDMVINVGALKDMDYEYVYKDSRINLQNHTVMLVYIVLKYHL